MKRTLLIASLATLTLAACNSSEESQAELDANFEASQPAPVPQSAPDEPAPDNTDMTDPEVPAGENAPGEPAADEPDENTAQ